MVFRQGFAVLWHKNTERLMNPIFMLISLVCDILFWIVILSVILSWLVAFNVVNTRNPLMARIYNALNGFTERLYAPIRRVIPTVYGGIDISPVIVLLILYMIQYTLRWLSVKYGI
jgi:YggT family protein